MVRMIRLHQDDEQALRRLVAAFALRNRSLNYSPQTVQWYSDLLDLFIRWLEENGQPATLGDLAPESIRGYVLYLQERAHARHPRKGLAPDTIHGHVRALKAFASFLYEDRYTETNRLAGVSLPRVPHRMVDILTEGEIRGILAAIPSRTVSGFRNFCIVWTLLDTGLRAGELVRLRAVDANFESGYLKVMGKGSRERIAPAGREAQRLLLRYVGQIRPEPSHPDVVELFLNDAGLPITVNAVGKMLRRLGQRSGVTRLHAHLLRHTFATNFLRNGGDLVSLKRILGHSSLEMVQRYVHLLDADLLARHHQFSPMDRLRGARRAQAGARSAPSPPL